VGSGCSVAARYALSLEDQDADGITKRHERRSGQLKDRPGCTLVYPELELQRRDTGASRRIMHITICRMDDEPNKGERDGRKMALAYGASQWLESPNNRNAQVKVLTCNLRPCTSDAEREKIQAPVPTRTVSLNINHVGQWRQRSGTLAALSSNFQSNGSLLQRDVLRHLGRW
jgi:hypothetical protein